MPDPRITVLVLELLVVVAALAFDSWIIIELDDYKFEMGIFHIALKFNNGPRISLSLTKNYKKDDVKNLVYESIDSDLSLTENKQTIIDSLIPTEEALVKLTKIINDTQKTINSEPLYIYTRNGFLGILISRIVLTLLSEFSGMLVFRILDWLFIFASILLSLFITVLANALSSVRLGMSINLIPALIVISIASHFVGGGKPSSSGKKSKTSKR